MKRVLLFLVVLVLLLVVLTGLVTAAGELGSGTVPNVPAEQVAVVIGMIVALVQVIKRLLGTAWEKGAVKVAIYCLVWMLAFVGACTLLFLNGLSPWADLGLTFGLATAIATGAIAGYDGVKLVVHDWLRVV